MPKTATGKIQKAKLRAELAAIYREADDEPLSG
jgi:acyl-coenzyme A synthetase/AMP-(fatty) acid ligase